MAVATKKRIGAWNVTAVQASLMFLWPSYRYRKSIVYTARIILWNLAKK